MTSGRDHVVQDGSRSGTLIRHRRGTGGLTAPAEARLLEIIGPYVPLRVPRVVRVLSQDTMEIERIPGRPLLSVPPEGLDLEDRQRLAGLLGRFAAALASVPVERVGEWVPIEEPDPEEYRSEAAAALLAVQDTLPGTTRTAVDRFLNQEYWIRPPALYVCHQDLGAEHVFVDAGPSWAVTGVIDFSDAAVADPALDLGLILRDLGTDAFGHALAGFSVSGGDTREVAPRALTYARCRALEDLVFGLQNDAVEYADNGFRAVLALFSDVA